MKGRETEDGAEKPGPTLADAREADAALAKVRTQIGAVFGFVFLAASAALMSADEVTLVEHFVADDFYYYVDAARQLVATGTVSVDGVNPTNGFHPLFLLVCAAVTQLGGSPSAIPLMSLLVLLAAHLSAGMAVAGIATRRVGTSAGVAAVIAFCSPLALGIAASGHETALLVFCMVFALRAAERALVTPSVRTAAAAGCWAGVACWARLDALLWLPVLGGALALASWKTEQRTSGVVRGGIAAAAGALVISPFLVWGQQTVGRALPVSLEAMQLWKFHPYELTGSFGGDLAALVDKFRSATYWSDRWAAAWGGWPGLHGNGLWSTLFCLAVIGLAAYGAKRLSRRFRIAPWLALFLVAHTLYYVLFAEANPRYLFLEILLVPIAALHGLRSLADRFGPRAGMVVSAVVLVGATTNILFATADAGRLRESLYNEYHRYHRPMWEEIPPLIEQHVPEGANVGSFNSGIIGHRTRRRVVNLDGVMNNAAAAALAQGGFRAYLREQRIEYVGDWSVHQIDRFMRIGGWADWRAGAELVASVEGPRGRNEHLTWELWRIRP